MAKVKVKGASLDAIDRDSDEFADLIEKELRRVVNRSLDGLGNVIVAQGYASAVTPDSINDIKTLWRSFVMGRLFSVLTRMLFQASETQAERTNAAIGRVVAQPLDQLLLTTTFVENSQNRLTAIGDELWENARDELVLGIEEGESIPKLAARVREATEVTMPRATAIARTEVVGAHNRASLATVRATGLMATKEWLSAEDQRTRPTHLAAEGQTVPEDKPFIVGGFSLDHPGDPSGPPQEVINCRCTSAYGFEIGDFEESDTEDPDAIVATSETESFATLGDKLRVNDTLGSMVKFYIQKDRPGAPDGNPWAVVRLGGKPVRDFESVELAVTAMSHYQDMPDDDDNDDECPPGHHRMPDGECMPNDDMYGSGNINVSGIAAVEGKWTGDGRQFALGSLSWPEPGEASIPLQWQKETAHGGTNDVTVNVGWLTSLERKGDQIFVTGVIDSDSLDGAEAERFLRKRGRFGVSIVADDPEQADVEFTFPEGCSDNPESFDCMSPKGVTFHSGRIRALTLVDVPAFVEAYIELSATDALTASMITLGAVAAHNTATVDVPWDSDVQVGKLDSPMPETKARNMYAWIDYDAVEDGEVTKSGCRFPHHEVNADGTPGAANLTACSAGIGALNGARGGTNIPRGDMQGVYDHLAAHLRDADREPPPATFSLVDALEPLVAASHIIEIPEAPPAEWFNEPTELPEVGAITVTDDGRIFGLLAPADVAHRSFRERVTVPTGVDYSRWMNRQTITDNGDRVTTGPITMSCGHASTDPRMDASATVDHYDNSCSIVATVRIGENRFGTWISGALLPDITPYQIARMLACQLSGDWRPHREQPGKREFCGALLVPVPGFPRAASATVRVTAGQLVAASAPMTWASADDVDVTPVDLSEDVVQEVSEVQEDSVPEEVMETEVVEEVSASDSEILSEPQGFIIDDLPSWEDIERRKDNRAKAKALAESLGI